MESNREMRARRKPDWLKKRLPEGGGVVRVEKLLRDEKLHTVCQGAKCPNRNDCFQSGTATFLILGDVCTRQCSFCSIPSGSPPPVDPDEPERLARAALKMGLRYVVVTSVTRDDLPDGGASHFGAVVQALKAAVPAVRVEVLVPDFRGNREALRAVLGTAPAVLNHNVETVPSLYAAVRPGADYNRSLGLLAEAASWEGIAVKSGFMLGLGETMEEVRALLADLRGAGVDLVTVGQYLKPAAGCLDVKEYLHPDRFDGVAHEAERLGFRGVASGPFVRSSFQAAELLDNASSGAES